MKLLLRLVTVMLVTLGAFLWLVFLSQFYEKIVRPETKNLRGEEFFLVGLVLTLIHCHHLFWVSK